jgi:2-polyprenyl-3-methyl-5-hydroxy-6-metoxy-1,4-benzoquinol methylase
VPWAPDPPVIYEHYHRYLFAADVVDGREVLDLASGEGFGAALMAGRARSVVGIDIETDAVEHARRNYEASNLEFRVGDARELATTFPAGAFGAVVAFELIEHMAEHDALLAGIGHVLSDDGILIISSPDRTAYSDDREFENPFHVRELTASELLDLLRGRFSSVAAWAQRTVTGSALFGLDPGPTTEDRLQRFVLERVGDEWCVGGGISPMYVIAVASNAELPRVPRESVLVDPGQELLRAAEVRAEEGLAVARADVAALRGDLDAMRARVLELGDLLANHQRLNAELTERAAGDAASMGRLQAELLLAHKFRTGVEGSVSWRVLQMARGVLYRAIGGRGSPVGRRLQRVLRGLGRLVFGLRD